MPAGIYAAELNNDTSLRMVSKIIKITKQAPDVTREPVCLYDNERGLCTNAVNNQGKKDFNKAYAQPRSLTASATRLIAMV